METATGVSLGQLYLCLNFIEMPDRLLGHEEVEEMSRQVADPACSLPAGLERELVTAILQEVRWPANHSI